MATTTLTPEQVLNGTTTLSAEQAAALLQGFNPNIPILGQNPAQAQQQAPAVNAPEQSSDQSSLAEETRRIHEKDQAQARAREEELRAQQRLEAQQQEQAERDGTTQSGSRIPTPQGTKFNNAEQGQGEGQEQGPKKKMTRAEAKLDRLTKRADSLNDNREALRDLAAQARDTEKMAGDKKADLNKVKTETSERISSGHLSKRSAKDVVAAMKQEHKDLNSTLKNSRKEAKVYDKAADGWKTRVKATVLDQRVANMEAKVQFRNDMKQMGREVADGIRDVGRKAAEGAAHGVAKGASATMQAARNVGRDLLGMSVSGGTSVAAPAMATTGMGQPSGKSQGQSH